MNTRKFPARLSIFHLLEFDRYAEIVEMGYNAAKEQLKGCPL